MKKILIIMTIFTMSVSSLLADEIHLKNKTILKGKIIQVTKVNIEYDPDGESVYDVVPRDEVVKIVYANNKTIYFTQKKVDTIFFNNGTYVKGKIFKVTSETIVYYPEGANQSTFVSRDKIEKIIFSNGKELVLNRGQLEFSNAGLSHTFGREKVYEKKWEPFYQTGGFHSAIAWLRITGSIPIGSTKIKKEVDYYNTNSTSNNKVEHELYTYGITLGLFLPSIKFKQESNFNITGLKIGIKGVHNFGSLVQLKTSDDSDSNDDSSNARKELLAYQSIGVGPEICIILTPRSNNLSMLLHLYATYEVIYNGKIKPAPQLRNEGYEIDKDANFANVSGDVFRVGIGPHLTMNKSFPLTFGVDLYYSYTRFDFDKQVAIYANNELSYRDIGLEFSIGIHL